MGISWTKKVVFIALVCCWTVLWTPMTYAEETCEDICLHEELTVPYTECMALVWLYLQNGWYTWTNTWNRTLSPDVDSWWWVTVSSVSWTTHVTELLLPNNNLVGWLSAWINGLPYLTQIDLKNNALTQLPETIDQLINLEQLSTSYNSLVTLPAWVFELPKLLLLEAEYNYIASLPEFILSWTTLELISLHHNRLSNLPDSFSQLTALRQLFLQNNLFVEQPIELFSLSELLTVHLAWNKLVDDLNAWWSALENLIYLNIANNQLTHQQNWEVIIPQSLEQRNSRDWFILVGDGQRWISDSRIELVPDHPPLPYVQATPEPLAITLSEYVRSLLMSNEQPVLVVWGSNPLCQQLDVVVEITPTDEILLRMIPQAAWYYAWCSVQIADFDGTLLPPWEMPAITVVAQAQLDFCAIPWLTVSQETCHALLALYSATNGPNRKNKSWWFVSPNIETWFWVSTKATAGTWVLITGLHFHTDQNALWTNAMQWQWNGLQWMLPDVFDALTGLETINFGNNKITWSLPSTFASLTELEAIYFQNNQLYGALDLVAHPWVRILYLKNNLFSGSIDTLLNTLPWLEIIDISKNNLSGQLPVFSSQAPLRFVNFAENKFSGTLPEQRAQAKQQTHLYLQNNNLEGTIPTVWKTRTWLTNVTLDNNFLDRDTDNSATLSQELIPRWQWLLVKSRANQRDAIAPVIAVQWWFVASGNASYWLTITITENGYPVNASDKWMSVFVSGGSWCSLMQISDVRVATWTTTLTVTPWSAWIYEWCFMHVLDHGQNFSNGLALPTLWHNLGDQAICFDKNLSVSEQECRILRDLRTSTSWAQWINKNNRWQNTNVNSWFGIDTELIDWQTHVVAILLHRNDITSLDVSGDEEAKGNNLRGSLPSSITWLTKLRYFKGDDNALWWSLAMMSQPLLEHFTASKNNFSGWLPWHRWSWSVVKVLDLSYNAFVWWIPAWWKQLRMLETLSLAHNQLSGKLELTSQDRWNLVSFSVAHNTLTWGLDPDWSSQKQLENIDFSHNTFAWTIPSTRAILTWLKTIDLSQNKLSGPIPTAFSAFDKITHFYASWNALIGDINDLFPSWTTLKKLDVENNRFTGKFALSRGQLNNLQQIMVAKNALDRDSNHDAIIPFELINWRESRQITSREQQDDTTPTLLSSPTTILSPVAAQVYRTLQRDENSYTVDGAWTWLRVWVDWPGLCSGLVVSHTQIATWWQQTWTIDLILAPTISGVYSCFMTVTDQWWNISRLPITPFWFKATCGNWLIETVEECDEGRFCADWLSCTDDISLCPFTCATQFMDWCNPACDPSTCGDGYVDSVWADAMTWTNDDEQCDPGKYCADWRECTRDPSICLTGPEECQPMPTSTCSPTCVLLSCGDGYYDSTTGEQCDDGNNIQGDWCSANCIQEYCGDGIIDANGSDNIVWNDDDEACDAWINNWLLWWICTADCKLPDPSCMQCWQYCHDVLESWTWDHAIYLVIDRTWSMNWQNRLENAQNAASTFINLLPWVDWTGAIVEEWSLIGIVTFANGANLEIIHTDDYTWAISELMWIQASSNADMGAWISLAAAQLALRTESEKWIILLSDGTPTRPQWSNNAGQSALTAATIAKQAGVKIISIWLQQGTKWKTLLQNISSGTGYYYEDPNNNILTEIYQYIYWKIHCGCTDTQQFCSTCGDNQVLFNEQCDEWSFCDDWTDCSTNSALCPSECKPRTSQTCTQQCQLPFCGDWVLQTWANEQCDDGNTIAGDGCTATCQNEYCGDWVVDINGSDNQLWTNDDEQCDDSNSTNGDGCSSTCKAEICGDGQINWLEQCDEWRFCNDGTACTANPWICPGECKTRSTASCGADCTFWVCGDGYTDSNWINNFSGDSDDEQCDPGKFCANGIPCTHDASLCPGSCEVRFTTTCTQFCKQTYCGDGYVDLDGVDDEMNTAYDNEQCDDWNNRYGDGCSPSCQLEWQDWLSCGDWIKQAYELCDPSDPNDLLSDSCSSECIPWSCGDGIVHWDEACDTWKWCNDGVTNCTSNPSICQTGPTECQTRYIAGCTQNCAAGCGNGIVDADGVDNILGNEDDESCDDWDAIDTDSCTTTCKLPSCGDWIVTHYALIPGTGWWMTPYMETCDDGNTNDNDACPSTCTWTGSIMAWTCAANNLQSLFYDNENTTFADISVFCDRGIPDWSPIYDPNTHTWQWVCLWILWWENTICEYDAWSCGDGIVDTRTDPVSWVSVHEECDDWNTQAGDGCTASCLFESPLLFSESWQCSTQSYPAIQPSEYLPVWWESTPRTPIATWSCAVQQVNTLITPEEMICDFTVTRWNPAWYEQEVWTIALPCIGLHSWVQLIEDALHDKWGNGETVLWWATISPTQIEQLSLDTDWTIIYWQYRFSLDWIRFQYCANTRVSSTGQPQMMLLERTFETDDLPLCQWQRSLSPSYFMHHTSLFSEQLNTWLDGKITNISWQHVYLADTSYTKLQKSTYWWSIKNYLLAWFINAKTPLATKWFRVDSEQWWSLQFQKIPNAHIFVYPGSTPLTLDRQTIGYLLSQAWITLPEHETTPFTLIVPDQRVTTTLVGDIPGKMMLVTNGDLVFAAENCDTNDVVQWIYVANGTITTTKTVNDRLDAAEWCNWWWLTLQWLLLWRDLATTLWWTRRSSIHFWDNDTLLYPSTNNVSYMADAYYTSCVQSPLLFDLLYTKMNTWSVPYFWHPTNWCLPWSATWFINNAKPYLIDLLFQKNWYFDRVFNENNTPLAKQFIDLLPWSTNTAQQSTASTMTIQYENKSYVLQIPSWKQQQLITAKKQLPDVFTTSLNLNDQEIQKKVLALFEPHVWYLQTRFQNIDHPYQNNDGRASIHTLLWWEWWDAYVTRLQEQNNWSSESFCQWSYLWLDWKIYDNQQLCQFTYSPLYAWMINAKQTYKSTKASKESILLQWAWVQVVPAPTLRQNPPPGATDIFSSLIISR